MAKNTLKLILLSVSLIVTAQLMLKYGIQSAQQKISTATLIPFFKSMLLNPYVIVGIALFGASAALWMLVLSRADLSYAYPILSLGYVLTAIGAWLLFNENLSPLRIGGIIIVCAGVFALSKS